MRLAFVALVAMLLGGCVSVPKTEWHADATIRRVAILPVDEPPSYPVLNLGGPAGMFGLAGGLVQAALNDQHSRGYTDALKDRKVVFAPALERELRQALETAGYQVGASTARPAVVDARTFDYTAMTVDGDAMLHVWFTTLGYVSPPSRAAFLPWVGVRVRLVDARSHADLYFKTFSCGYKTLAENVVHVGGDPDEYPTYDVLVSDADRSAVSLSTCVARIAKAAAADFARR
jgi:hypothetical protein